MKVGKKEQKGISDSDKLKYYLCANAGVASSVPTVPVLICSMLRSPFHILSTANDVCIYKDQEPFSSILNIYDNLLKVIEFHS